MDTESSERMYRLYCMKVFSYAMTLTKNRHSAEEITQEAFYRAITTSHTFKGESDELTWLCAIAKNLFLDETRKSKRRAEKETDFEIADNSVESEVIKRDSSLKIHLILHSLEEPYREVFELRIFGELSFAEIGTVFCKTENWARVTYHRAVLKIKERMCDNG